MREDGCACKVARGVGTIVVVWAIVMTAAQQGIAANDCGELRMTTGGPYESGYAWEYSAQMPPDYGAFAECYSGSCEVCAVVLDLTGLGTPEDFYLDLYVWNDTGGEPDNVLCLTVNVYPGPVASWPGVSRHVMELGQRCCTGDSWWVGYWGQWVHSSARCWVAADLDGPTGCPKTKIAPGQNYPTGWQNVSIVWGPTHSLGIGAMVRPCPPVPAAETTWGGIKSLYR